MGHKHTRKNYYKNRFAKKRAKIMRIATSGMKIMSGIAFVTIMSLSFILCHDFLTQCDYFKAKSLTVFGSHRLSEKQVVEQAHINPGTNIFSVNLSIARKELLAHPLIAEAEVRRELPDRITIRIHEHRPLAILDLGRRFVINEYGEIFKEKDAADPDYLPVIKGLELSDLNVQGKPRGILFGAVIEILQLGQEQESVLPNRLIKGIRVDREIGLTLYTTDSEDCRIKAIKIGYNDYPSKYDKLKKVLFYINKRREFLELDSIDLKNLNRIVVNPTKIELPAMDQKEV